VLLNPPPQNTMCLGGIDEFHDGFDLLFAAGRSLYG
jgi:hypothetical protein